MHVAICDDNVADRKQSERLLGRESDSRLHTTGVLYIDSFGHSSALLKAPMLYDLFFIDMTQGGTDGMGLARTLREKGVTAPIVLCSSSIDYTARPDPPGQIYHLRKPLKAPEISACIEKALAVRSSLQRTYEIRCEQETHYVPAENIVMVEPEGHLARIVFEDGHILKMLGSPDDFYSLTQGTGKFLYAKKNVLVNRDYMLTFSMKKLQLKNGQSLSLNLADWRYLKKNCPELSK